MYTFLDRKLGRDRADDIVSFIYAVASVAAVLAVIVTAVSRA